MTGLLGGLRVVDLSRVLAGPFTTQILAEMGADVIKVEPPGGDMARGIGPLIDGRSLYFSALNTGKRGVVLDLTTDAGRRGLDALLSDSDVVVENYRPGAAEKLRVTPGELLAAHPQLVVVTISGTAGTANEQTMARTTSWLRQRAASWPSPASRKECPSGPASPSPTWPPACGERLERSPAMRVGCATAGVVTSRFPCSIRRCHCSRMSPRPPQEPASIPTRSDPGTTTSCRTGRSPHPTVGW